MSEFKPASDLLTDLGLDVKDVLAGMNTPNISDTTHQICLCGHAVGRHSQFDLTDGRGGQEVVVCKPSKMECPCRVIRPVLIAEDIRPFLRKTQGPGDLHALSRGIASLSTRGKNAAWIYPMSCDRCGSWMEDGARLMPIAVNLGGEVTFEPTGYDALICSECLSDMPYTSVDSTYKSSLLSSVNSEADESA